jgi:hypothetical protein
MRSPTPFWRGVLAGAVFGALAAAASPLAQRLVGRDGTLDGWSGLVEGEEVCQDPWISQGDHTIECE